MPLVARNGTVIVHEEPPPPETWNPSLTYSIDSVVEFEGQIWVALTDNSGTQPGTSPSDWASIEGTSASADGLLIASQFTVFAESIPVGRVGDLCSVHADDGGVVLPNSSTVFVTGIQIARVGDVTSCSPPGTLTEPGSATTVYADEGGV